MRAKVTIGYLSDPNLIKHSSAIVEYQGNVLSIRNDTVDPHVTEHTNYHGFFYSVPFAGNLIIFYGAEGTDNPLRRIMIEPIDTKLVDLLEEWLATPFFDTRTAWSHWLSTFKPKVMKALRREE